LEQQTHIRRRARVAFELASKAKNLHVDAAVTGEVLFRIGRYRQETLRER
jgi:hypothetical protein